MIEIRQIRHYIIPNGSDIFRIPILEPLNIYNRIQRLELQRVEASGESWRPAESKRTPFPKIAGEFRLVQSLGSYCGGNRSERTVTGIIEVKEVFSGIGCYGSPNFGGWRYPLHCRIRKRKWIWELTQWRGRLDGVRARRSHVLEKRVRTIWTRTGFDYFLFFKFLYSRFYLLLRLNL